MGPYLSTLFSCFIELLCFPFLYLETKLFLNEVFFQCDLQLRSLTAVEVNENSP